MTLAKLSVKSLGMTCRALKPVLILLFAFAALFPAHAGAASIEVQNYRRAFALVEAGHADQAIIFALKGHDLVLNKALRAYYMEQPGNNASFSEISSFIVHNPDWPGQRAMLMAAEQKIPADTTPEQIIRWFDTHPPIAIAAFYRYIDALSADGQDQQAASFVRARWIEARRDDPRAR